MTINKELRCYNGTITTHLPIDFLLLVKGFTKTIITNADDTMLELRIPFKGFI